MRSRDLVLPAPAGRRRRRRAGKASPASSPSTTSRSTPCCSDRPRSARTKARRRTDVIILTHDTVEGRMTKAIAAMQALPTVLAKHRAHSQGRPRVEIPQHARREQRRPRLQRHPARRPRARRRPLSSRALSEGRCRPRWRAGAASSYAELAFELISRSTSTTCLPADLARASLARTYTADDLRRRAHHVPLRPLGQGIHVLGLVERSDAGVQGRGDAVPRQRVRVRARTARPPARTCSARRRATRAAPRNTR